MDSMRTLIYERNQLLSQIRHFFRQRKVMEVDTPLLRPFTVTDPYMSAFAVKNPTKKQIGYLQTSPEYAMKGLLCRGSGDIFQLGKNFRADEQGIKHACEFTMLEWYRLGIDHFDLISEVKDLLDIVIGNKTMNLITYRAAFQNALSIDPFVVSEEEIERSARSLLGDIPENLQFDDYLSLLFSERVEPSFNPDEITVVHSYPANQACLAKTKLSEGRLTAQRFEIYVLGMELANGFNELTDAEEQYRRLENDNAIRSAMDKPNIEIDSEFITNLRKGLPDCAGVALGIDRLLMIKLGKENISEVILN